METGSERQAPSAIVDLQPSTNLTMSVNPDIACCMASCMEDLWNAGELQDVTINVEGQTFRCHRFMLGACSGFFRGLFRSGMKETVKNVVKLVGISAQTFRLILKTLYGSCEIITEENLIDVWNAANQLQIEFLVSRSESFAIEHLSLLNYEAIYNNSVLLDSEAVLQKARNFIIDHFDHFSGTKTFLSISFDELLMFVKSDMLRTASEDNVVDSIFTWVMFGESGKDKTSSKKKRKDQRKARAAREVEKENKDENATAAAQNNVEGCEREVSVPESPCLFDIQYCADRKVYLTRLIKAARVCLLSDEYLMTMARHELVVNNIKIRNIVDGALFYKLEGWKQGYWPPSALNRNCSAMKHAVVYIRAKTVFARSFPEVDKEIKVSDLPASLTPVKANRKLVVFHNNIVAIGSDDKDHTSILVFDKGTQWNALTHLPDMKYENFIPLALGDFIYLFGRTSQELFQIKPNLRGSNEVVLCKGFPSNAEIKYVFSFGQDIIVLCDDEGGKKEIVIHCYKTLSQEWCHLNHIGGITRNLISFKDESGQTFILQTNGSLWQVVSTQQSCPNFRFVAKLWEFTDEILQGAVCYGGELWIMSTSGCNDEQWVKGLPGLFPKIRRKQSAFNDSTFFPLLLSKSLLTCK